MKTIVDLLRFCGVMGEPRRRLSLYSGLSHSRVSRILQGRASPSPDELHRLLGLAGGGSLPVLTPLILNASRGQDAELRIDGFSCTFQSVSDGQEWARAQAVTGWNRRWHRSKATSAYRTTCTVGPSFILQREPRFATMAPYRMEVKAAALLDESTLRSSFRHITSAFDLSQCRVTRFDVAVDLPVAVQDLLVVHPNARNLELFPHEDGSCSYYFGRRRARATICIYDRTARRTDGPWTRVEVRLCWPAFGVRDIESLPNPFARHRVLVARTKASRSLVESLLSYGNRQGGAALRLALRTPSTRNGLVDLDEHPLLAFWHPREVFRRRWPEQARRFIDVLTNGAGS